MSKPSFKWAQVHHIVVCILYAGYENDPDEKYMNLVHDALQEKTGTTHRVSLGVYLTDEFIRLHWKFRDTQEMLYNEVEKYIEAMIHEIRIDKSL